jgi:hypothetical protein
MAPPLRSLKIGLESPETCAKPVRTWLALGAGEYVEWLVNHALAKRAAISDVISAKPVLTRPAVGAKTYLDNHRAKG